MHPLGLTNFSLFNFVQRTTDDLSPQNLHLPSPLWSLLSLLNRIHGIWRWYRRAEVYRDPNNFAHLLAGHVVNYIGGNSFLLRVAAQTLLIATRILDCIHRQASVCRAARKLLNAIQGNTLPSFRLEKTRVYKKLSVFSPSTIYWWQTHSSNTLQRVIGIAACAFILIKKIFKMSMTIMDVIDAFSINPATQYDAIPECFVNAKIWLKTIASNREELLEGFLKNEALITRVLSHTPFTYVQLYDFLSTTLETTEVLHKQSEKISRFGGNFIREVGKKALNTSLVVIGLGDYRPMDLLPS